MRVAAARLRCGRLPLMAAVLIASLTACDTASSGGNGSPPSTPPVSTPTTSALSADDAVVAAYDEFWNRLRHVEGEAEKDWEGYLGEVAVDPQLKLSLQATRFQKMNGITLYGEVRSRVSDVKVDGDDATVVDCQDASRSGQADAKTGEKKTVGVARNPIEARLERDGGEWKVAEVTYPGGAC